MESELELPRTVGRYTLTRWLGKGGMGVVYAARDNRLGREVAVKMIAGLQDDAAVRRFWREARTAASINHPNVCQIFEVDESPEGLFLAMELLDGEPLDVRMAREPCPAKVSVDIAVDLLGALAAIHQRGLVHRDVKPSNVFLTAHGVKLLDFGLARPVSDETQKLDVIVANQITTPGMIVGTPRYMSPEQILGRVVDGRSDLFSVGTLLFEMLAGRPPFVGENVFDLARAVLNEHPPALRGPAAIVAVDRVIRRALAKNPDERFQRAEAMADELRKIQVDDDLTPSMASVKALLRLLVLPLRIPRDDPDAAFLSYGLAEAVSGSLAGLSDVVVRSPSVASRFAAADADPRRLAAEADVDVIVSGSVSRMGDQLRATLQLVDAGSGTVVGGTSVHGRMQDIFAFEDQLTQGVVGLLAPSGRPPRATRRLEKCRPMDPPSSISCAAWNARAR